MDEVLEIYAGKLHIQGDQGAKGISATF